jgi:heme O synthase-like polyprenyltransferase
LAAHPAAAIISGAMAALWATAALEMRMHRFASTLSTIGGALQMVREPDPDRLEKLAIRYFSFSITHLTVLFGAVAIDQLVGWGV